MSNNKGKPFAVVDRYSGSAQAYQTVAVWKVGQIWEKNHGCLDEISMNSDDYSKTRFRLTVEGKIFFKDLQLQGELELLYRHPNELPRGEEVKVECKSSDGTAIVVTASIAGVEY